MFAGLLLGGSLGNAVEHAQRGAISDYVRLRFWPAFNLADAAIAPARRVSSRASFAAGSVVSAAPVHGAVVRLSPLRQVHRAAGQFLQSPSVRRNLLRSARDRSTGEFFRLLTFAFRAGRNGLRPLGIVGARLYFLIVNASHFASRRSLAGLWDGREGGLVCSEG